MSTPYSHLTDVQLIDELASLDEAMKADSEALDLNIEEGSDYEIIEGIRDNLEHAAADYGWLKKELWNRGYVHNTLTDTWHKPD